MPELQQPAGAAIFKTKLSTAVSAATTATCDFAGLTMQVDEMTVCAATSDVRIAAAGGDYVITAPDQVVAIDEQGSTSFVDDEGDLIEIELLTERPLTAQDVGCDAPTGANTVGNDAPWTGGFPPDMLDNDLTPTQLDAKYNPSGRGEHPVYPRKDWRADVAAEETILGYWEWVAYALDQIALMAVGEGA